MAPNVFITYSSKDEKTADAICRALEANEIGYWYAPRNIRSGASWAASIIDGLNNSRLMILVWSAHSNASPHVTREVHHAFKKNVTVIPFRIEDVAPTKDLEYYLASVQWFDATTPPLEDNLQRLIDHIRTFLPVDEAVVSVPEEETVNAGQNLDEEADRIRLEEERQLADEAEILRLEDEALRMAEAAAERQRIEEQERVRLAAAEKKAAEDERKRVEAQAERKRIEEQERVRLAAAEKKAAADERKRVEAEAERKRIEEQERLRFQAAHEKEEENRKLIVTAAALKATEADALKEKPKESSVRPSTATESSNVAAAHRHSPGADVAIAASEGVYTTSTRSFNLPLALMIAVGVVFILVLGWILLRSPTPTDQRQAVQAQAVSDPASSVSPQTPATTAPNSPPKKSFTGDFDVAKAFELIFGSYDYQRKGVKGKLTKEEIQASPIASQIPDAFLGTVYTGLHFEPKFQQGGNQRTFLITHTIPGDYNCHACAPIIGGATFSQRADAWELDAQTRVISMLGSGGQPPPVKLVQIGPDRYGVLFETSYSIRGISDEGIAIIGESEGILRELINLTDYASENAAGCGEDIGPCYSYSSKMAWVDGANPDYRDLRVVTTGTKLDDQGNIRKANKTRIYKFTGDKYALSK